MEMIIRGRSGQGAVTLSQLIAISAFKCGMQSQAFPFFGIERRGAPATAYVRISDKPIRLKSQIYLADAELILDSTLLGSIDFKKELKKGSLLIINSRKKSDELKRKFGLSSYKVFSFDATKVALKVLKKNIVNTSMLGAFAKLSGMIPLEVLDLAIDEKFPKERAIMNKKLIRETYEEIKNY